MTEFDDFNFVKFGYYLLNVKNHTIYSAITYHVLDLLSLLVIAKLYFSIPLLIEIHPYPIAY